MDESRSSAMMKVAQQPGFQPGESYPFIVDNLARSQLDERIAAMVETANAKKGNSRALSEITLKRWIAAFLNKAQNAAERLLLLAPGKRQEIKAEDINWLPEFWRSIASQTADQRPRPTRILSLNGSTGTLMSLICLISCRLMTPFAAQ